MARDDRECGFRRISGCSRETPDLGNKMNDRGHDAAGDMDLSHGERLFYTAVRSLFIGNGDLPDRVISAAHELLLVHEHDVPKAIHARLRKVLFGQQDVPWGGLAAHSGVIERVLKTRTDDELISIARQILDLHRDLRAALPPHSPLNPLVSPTREA
jgi:hypothetical protein